MTLGPDIGFPPLEKPATGLLTVANVNLEVLRLADAGVKGFEIGLLDWAADGPLILGIAVDEESRLEGFSVAADIDAELADGLGCVDSKVAVFPGTELMLLLGKLGLAPFELRLLPFALLDTTEGTLWERLASPVNEIVVEEPKYGPFDKGVFDTAPPDGMEAKVDSEGKLAKGLDINVGLEEAGLTGLDGREPKIELVCELAPGALEARESRLDGSPLPDGAVAGPAVEAVMEATGEEKEIIELTPIEPVGLVWVLPGGFNDSVLPVAMPGVEAGGPVESTGFEEIAEGVLIG